MKRLAASTLALIMVLCCFTGIYAYADTEVGDVITFGSYEQDGKTKNGEEPIKWLVLDVDGDKALIITQYGLDVKPYNTTKTAVTWETCSIRKWLNEDFMDAAFSTQEKNAVMSTTIDDSKSKGSKTEDKIFLLTVDEMRTYLGFAMAKHYVVPSAYTGQKGSEGTWWLRSPYSADDIALQAPFIIWGVDQDGLVRPACWVDLAAIQK